jgi:hypothetical protein
MIFQGSLQTPRRKQSSLIFGFAGKKPQVTHRLAQNEIFISSGMCMITLMHLLETNVLARD